MSYSGVTCRDWILDGIKQFYRRHGYFPTAARIDGAFIDNLVEWSKRAEDGLEDPLLKLKTDPGKPVSIFKIQFHHSAHFSERGIAFIVSRDTFKLADKDTT